ARLPVPQLQVRLHHRVVVARAPEVGADRDAHGAVVVLLDAHRRGQPGRDATGVDDDAGVVGALLPRPPALGVHRAGGDAEDASRALVAHGAGDGHALAQPRTAGGGVPGEGLVEVHPGAGQAVGRHLGELGPGDLDAVAGAVGAQPPVADPAVGLLGGHAHA